MCRTAVTHQAVLPLEGLLAEEAAVGSPVLVVQYHVALHDEVVAQHLAAHGARTRAELLLSALRRRLGRGQRPLWKK